MGPTPPIICQTQTLAPQEPMPAGYKQPKDFVFVTLAELPRSTTGKIQRHEVEAWLRNREADRSLEK